MPDPSSLERTFHTYWNMFAQNAPQPVREYRFQPPRRWRFDLAWPEQKIAIELEGGIWTGGRHTRGKGFEADCEKYNMAALMGWRVLRYTSTMLERDPLSIIGQIQWLLEKSQGVK